MQHRSATISLYSKPDTAKKKAPYERIITGRTAQHHILDIILLQRL